MTTTNNALTPAVPEGLPETALSPLQVQYRLPPEEQLKLIKMPDNIAKASVAPLLNMAVELAKSAEAPLWAITMISSKQGVKPYINADGVMFVLANDVQDINLMDAEIIKMGLAIGELTIVKATIVMGDNREYRAHGAVMVDKDWNPANALLKAETKAYRRAAYKRIAKRVGMPLYDEDADPDRSRRDVDEGNFRVMHDYPTITLPDFLREVSEEEFEKVFGKAAPNPTQANVEQLYREVLAYRAKHKA